MTALARVKRWAVETLDSLPPAKDENDDVDDMINDAIRECAEEVTELLRAPRNFADVLITGEGMRSVGVYRHFLRFHLRKLRADVAAYEAEVKDWYENGDGRPSDEGGRGYAFPRCIHGADLWVDHDIPCGACEMGESLFDLARGYAREGMLRFCDHWEWVSAAPPDVNHEVRMTLHEQVFALFPKLEDI